MVRHLPTPVLVNSPGQLALPLPGQASLNRDAGSGLGALSIPISLGGSADGRVYVLEAGNACVQVLDLDGNHITWWGGRGRGPGEFDSGTGLSLADRHGSLDVDGARFIYVADATGRVQRLRAVSCVRRALDRSGTLRLTLRYNGSARFLAGAFAALLLRRVGWDVELKG